MASVLEELPGAIIGLIVGVLMNVIAIAIFSALNADWYYYVMLAAIDVAAVYGTIKHFIE